MAKIKQTVRYCDQNLPCSGIEKGDDFATVVQKLDDALCEGSGKTYTFEDNIEECENGGFNVYENDELIYTWCQDCCGDIPVEKDIFYEEVISTQNLTDVDYVFPLGYESLKYQNNSGVTKRYKVHVSYNTNIHLDNVQATENWVEGAIVVLDDIETLVSVEYEDQSVLDLHVSLYRGTLPGDVINATTTHYVVDDTSAHVEARLQNASIPNTVSFFKIVTLNNEEYVALQFKTKDTATINKAQILVEEI